MHQNPEIPSLDYSTLIRVIHAAGHAGVPVYLQGDPGMGKSALFDSVAASRGGVCEVVTFAGGGDRTDVHGLPARDGDQTVYLPPAWYLRCAAAKASVLLLDELPETTPDTQASLLTFLTTRRTVDGSPLPEGCWIVCAGNPPATSTTGGQIETALANRLLHLSYRPDRKVFTEALRYGWANAAPTITLGVDVLDGPQEAERRAQVATALGTWLDEVKPAAHYGFDEAARAWPSWRSWEAVVKVLARIPAGDLAVQMAAVVGLVGAVGREFVVWLDAADLPTATACLADPTIIAWGRGTRDDRLYAITSGIAGYVTAAIDTVDDPADLWTQAAEALMPGLAAGRAGLVKPALDALLVIRPPAAPIPKGLADLAQMAELIAGEAA